LEKTDNIIGPSLANSRANAGPKDSFGEDSNQTLVCYHRNLENRLRTISGNVLQKKAGSPPGLQIKHNENYLDSMLAIDALHDILPAK